MNQQNVKKKHKIIKRIRDSFKDLSYLSLFSRGGGGGRRTRLHPAIKNLKIKSHTL